MAAFTLEFHRSLESSLIARAQSFLEQRLVIKPFRFYVISFSHAHIDLLLRAKFKFSYVHFRPLHVVVPLGLPYGTISYQSHEFCDVN